MLNTVRKLMKTLATPALALGLGLSVVAADVAAAEYNWRFSNLYSRGTAFGELYENLGNNIEKLSDGRIKVQVLYSGEGVGTAGLLGAVKSGLITMGAPFQSMHAGELPAGVVEIGLPGVPPIPISSRNFSTRRAGATSWKKPTAPRGWYGSSLTSSHRCTS